MISEHSQKGMSIISWLMVLAVVAFLASTAFKVVPHYFDYMSLEKIITSVEADKASGVSSVSDFYGVISKGMQVNNIEDVNVRDEIKIKIFHFNIYYSK